MANKHFHIDPNKHGITNTLRRRLAKFGQYDAGIKRLIITAPLIAQLGKNFTAEARSLIVGDDLLKIACNTIKDIQMNLGGRFIYLECENKPQLTDFYTRNGFFNFGERALEPEETDVMQGKYLVQMLKYLR